MRCYVRSSMWDEETWLCQPSSESVPQQHTLQIRLRAFQSSSPEANSGELFYGKSENNAYLFGIVA
jgi:hypothetical protein